MEKTKHLDKKQALLEQHGDTTTAAIATSPVSGIVQRLEALFQALRPRQWTKNVAIFIGLFFAEQLFNITALERAVLAFIIFCLVSSSIYLFNDLFDLDKDRCHPVKKNRPLASGRLPIAWAIWAIGILLLISSGLIGLLYMIPLQRYDIFAEFGGTNVLFTLIIVFYICLMVLYTLRLKHVVLIDAFVIAVGFVLRIMVGTVAIPVSISTWLYLVTSFLSLFLALSKRRHELVLLQGEASNHRRILKEYSIPMLDQMITITATATLISYSLYTIESPTGHNHLLITIPFVLYGMFRYLYLVYMRMEGGSPEEVLLRDRHMLGTVLLCGILIGIILYLLPR